jgi:class 3 adenylate cyclase
MDVEDYHHLLPSFRIAVVAAVGRYEGFVARHQGDGMLVYFSYPQAHEDDAQMGYARVWR